MPKDDSDDEDDNNNNNNSNKNNSNSIISTIKSSILSLPIFKKNPIDAALQLLTDSDGKLLKLFKDYQIKNKEKKQWVLQWLDLDSNIKNNVKYKDFCAYFNLADSLWIRRVYEIIDDSNKGMNFLSFMTFCMKYLTIDVDSINEFSMRILSRRCSTFQPYISILDSEDIKFFVSLRYEEFKDQVKRKKRASEIVDYIDRCRDGAIDMGDFVTFGNQNPVFLRFSVLFQQHFRKCIFGTKYWVNKSRALKKHYAKGFDVYKFANEINSKAERLCKHADSPVIDDDGYIIDELKKTVKAPPKDETKESGDDNTDKKESDADNKIPEEDDFKIVFKEDADAKGDLSNQIDKTVKKPFLKFRGTFDAMNIDIRKYEIDFPDVVRAEFEQKMIKQSKKRDMMRKANDLALNQKMIDDERRKPTEDEVKEEIRKKEEEEQRKKEEEATFHERIKMKTDQLLELHDSDDHVCETYLSSYNNIIHHNNEIIHPNRTRHLQKSIISLKK